MVSPHGALLCRESCSVFSRCSISVKTTEVLFLKKLQGAVLIDKMNEISSYSSLMLGTHGMCTRPVNPLAIPHCWLQPMPQQLAHSVAWMHSSLGVNYK